jgi:hypothetical protein
MLRLKWQMIKGYWTTFYRGREIVAYRSSIGTTIFILIKSTDSLIYTNLRHLIQDIDLFNY